MRIKRGKSICLFSSKGGVGKTFNAISLAGIFELLTKRVLIIDFDLYSGDIATYLNKKVKKDIYDLSLDLDGRVAGNIRDYVTKIDDFIDILAAPIDPRLANKVNANNIADIINKGTLEYDVVLIDTNHALNEISLSVLQTVDRILLLTKNDPLDVKSLKNLITILDEYEYTNYDIVLNNSRDPFKRYFTFFDLKKLIYHHIKYVLSEELYLRDMDKYIMDGIIVTLDKKFPDYFFADYKTYLTIASDILGGENNE